MATANVDLSSLADPKRYRDVHCPFGCAKTQHDENMYCCHLIGFTKKLKKYEPIIRTKKGGVSVRALTVKASKDDDDDDIIEVTPELRPILATDVLVNPEVQQRDENGTHVMKLWPSTRVYRKISEEDAQKWRAKHVAMIEHEDELELMESA
jgi:hypothetical protein